ncbi:carbohydrate ABC transporter permease [Ruania halotolerans]|uniref:carbohydrate ABC transporter permease n=1 Tax=Ruania halotolerans TaxID=2897773 RepID=UPI001E48D7FE|nr:carbohydrate ABC transporter permease [Ruania halotolerans]UFU06978.1 carbohydrate ABC transporter permease [Ruania halotolerans]
MLWWVGIFIAALLWVLPLGFVVITSLKDEADILGTSLFSLPSVPDWGNYLEALETGGLMRSAGNSLLVSMIKVPLGLLVSASAAFALARIRFQYSGVVLAVIAFGAMVPVQVALAPLFQIMLATDLLNNPLGLILPYIGFGLPYQVFILYGFFRQIPAELDESAVMDGASNARLFFQIILPLARPALAALFILDFVATWNEFGIALVVLQQQESWTVPLAVQGFQSQFTTSYGPINAFTLMSIVPVLIVYLMFQRYFIRGAFAGAVKG